MSFLLLRTRRRGKAAASPPFRAVFAVFPCVLLFAFFSPFVCFLFLFASVLSFIVAVPRDSDSFSSCSSEPPNQRPKSREGHVRASRHVSHNPCSKHHRLSLSETTSKPPGTTTIDSSQRSRSNLLSVLLSQNNYVFNPDYPDVTRRHPDG